MRRRIATGRAASVERPRGVVELRSMSDEHTAASSSTSHGCAYGSPR